MEGLHLSRRLNKDRSGGRARYEGVEAESGSP
jgi:hypothetical protein